MTSANRFDKDTRASSGVLSRLIEHTHSNIHTSAELWGDCCALNSWLGGGHLCEWVCLSYAEFSFNLVTRETGRKYFSVLCTGSRKLFLFLKCLEKNGTLIKLKATWRCIPKFSKHGYFLLKKKPKKKNLTFPKKCRVFGRFQKVLHGFKREVKPPNFIVCKRTPLKIKHKCKRAYH